jgi:hypothetical protein
MNTRDIILEILAAATEPMTMTEILDHPAALATKLCREDVQYVLRTGVLDHKTIRQYEPGSLPESREPRADSSAWSYSLRDRQPQLLQEVLA